MRVVRVVPDVPALDRTFDYVVPADVPHADALTVGTIVRVPLHGRRVRGWVVEVDVAASVDRLRPIHAIVSAGPPPAVVELASWAAWRWIGPTVAFLRVASPPNHVPPPAGAGAERDRVTPSVPPGVSILEWPPGRPRFEVVRHRVAAAGSTVIVLPDGGRARSLGRGLREAGHRVVELLPGARDHERTITWRQAREGNCVIVGGRRAVWAPVPDLASVIVLDDADESLQEERAPTWHAREVGVERAARAAASYSVVSPAPTLEAVALVGEDLVERPDRRTVRDGWPVVEVVDPRADPARSALLTEAFVRAARRVLATGHRVVCVLNRTGRVRMLACAKCAAVARCERCGAAVGEATTEVAGAARASRSGSAVPTRLECPQCGLVRPRVCLECHGTRMKLVRIGAGRLRDDLAALLPEVTVAEVAAGDTTVPAAAVLVGTEAVLHWARYVEGDTRPALVGLVAYLDFDAELLAPRARAGEQALWLLVRGARLLGNRTEADADPRRILIQSRIPDHAVIETARSGSPASLRADEARRRAELGDPPFGSVALLSGAPASVADATAMLAADVTVRVLGPVISGTTARTLVRAANHDLLHAAVSAPAAAARSHGRLRVEVDPARA